MSWLGRFGRTQSSQQAFVILLVVCAAQLAYWLIDETRYTGRVNEGAMTGSFSAGGKSGQWKAARAG